MERIRKGDRVAVTAGKEKGKQGVVIRVLTDKDRVVVRGVNLVKKHRRPTQANPNGGIVEQEGSLPISNVMPVDPTDGKPCRVRHEVRDGAKVRVSVRTGAVITPQGV